MQKIKDSNGREINCPTCGGKGEIPDPNAARPEDFDE